MTLPIGLRDLSSHNRAFINSSSSRKSSRLKASKADTSVCNCESCLSGSRLRDVETASTTASTAAIGVCSKRAATRRANGSEISSWRPRGMLAHFFAVNLSCCIHIAWRFFEAINFMVRKSRCSTSATCCCVTGRSKECTVLKGKFTAPKPLKVATTVTPSTPTLAINTSAEKLRDSMPMSLPDMKSRYQKTGSVPQAQAFARRCDQPQTLRTDVQTKQAGSTR
mmetsp:Transcript_33354/g.92050  ORF Transcript_33354/g.92050 Transcript_33354/m.92050 type:complete len:224 (+) Transcript_33354:639-1310(+)